MSSISLGWCLPREMFTVRYCRYVDVPHCTNAIDFYFFLGKYLCDWCTFLVRVSPLAMARFHYVRDYFQASLFQRMDNKWILIEKHGLEFWKYEHEPREWFENNHNIAGFTVVHGDSLLIATAKRVYRYNFTRRIKKKIYYNIYIYRSIILQVIGERMCSTTNLFFQFFVGLILPASYWYAEIW